MIMEITTRTENKTTTGIHFGVRFHFYLILQTCLQQRLDMMETRNCEDWLHAFSRWLESSTFNLYFIEKSEDEPTGMYPNLTNLSTFSTWRAN